MLFYRSPKRGIPRNSDLIPFSHLGLPVPLQQHHHPLTACRGSMSSPFVHCFRLLVPSPYGRHCSDHHLDSSLALCQCCRAPKLVGASELVQRCEILRGDGLEDHARMTSLSTPISGVSMRCSTIWRSECVADVHDKQLQSKLLCIAFYLALD